jgi:hypothetical protein
MRKSISLAHYRRFPFPAAASTRAGYSVRPQGNEMPPVWETVVTTLKCFSTRRPSNAADTVEMPRTFPTVGFPNIQSGQLVEEEELPVLPCSTRGNFSRTLSSDCEAWFWYFVDDLACPRSKVSKFYVLYY